METIYLGRVIMLFDWFKGVGRGLWRMKNLNFEIDQQCLSLWRNCLVRPGLPWLAFAEGVCHKPVQDEVVLVSKIT